MSHQDDAERLLPLCPWNETTALAHAVLALVERLEEMPLFALMGVEEDEDEE